MNFILTVLALIFTFRMWSLSEQNTINIIRSRYGSNYVIQYRIYENSRKKLEKAKLDLKFLEACKIYNVIPKFLRFKLHTNFYKAWQSKLLINEINLKKQTKKKIEAGLEDQKDKVMNALSPWGSPTTDKPH